jgi:hypothetical protein
MSNLINYKEVSRILAGGTENIRRNNIPKKYSKAVDEIMNFAKYWTEKYK